MAKDIVNRVSEGGGSMGSGSPQDMRDHTHTSPKPKGSSKGNAAPPNVHGTADGGKGATHNPKPAMGDTPPDKVRRTNVIAGGGWSR